MSGACRVCGSPETTERGHVEYLEGSDSVVSDCAACGCRFTAHDPSAHRRFHLAPAISYYKEYVEIADQCVRLFREQDLDGLKRYLRRWSKYRLVIDEVSRAPMSSRLLEAGCSRGYLTSCFILEGRPVLGVDVSPDAVQSARDAFGDHFAVAGTAAVEAGGPYDLIYHVGMIGCVADPVGLTRQLLSLLKPGGRLLFNAPNRAALHLRGQLWLDSAPPPDLVTLFPQGFWTRQFSTLADVTESVEWRPADEAIGIWLDLAFHRRWRPPVPQPMSASGAVWVQPGATGLLNRALRKFARLMGLSGLAPHRASDFGLFVRMTAK